MSRKKILFLLILIIIAGTFVRLQSVLWNKYIHGDVRGYSEVAESLANRGDTRMSYNPSEQYVYYSIKEKGGKFYDMYPLLPFLGAFLIKIKAVSHGYSALKIISFFSGILIIILTYFLGKKISGENAGLLSAALVSFSYLLIDFSGNGSIYALQTVFYLLFLLLLLNLKKAGDNFLLGVVIGFAVLTNYQSIILFPVHLIFLFILFKKDLLKILKWFFLGFTPAVLIYLPWGVRNFLLFHDPFFSTLSSYYWQKLGLKKIIKGDMITFDVNLADYFTAIKRTAFFWFPHNLYFINRKLFIFAPISYMFFLFSVVETVFFKSFERIKNLIPIFLLIIFHIILGAIVPIFETRHFVPFMPFVFILASWYIFEFIKKPILQKITVSFSVFAIIIFSVLTYYSIPTHTYYYDGTITESVFGKDGGGEIRFLKIYYPDAIKNY